MNRTHLHLVPVRSRQAKDFVRAWHRHHPPPAGQVFSVGVADESGPSGYSACIQRRQLTMASWDTATPLGRPVDPEV
ncbi:hypothetical protein RND61_23630 [Streptomyces sp. TRM76323]|uniref:Transposase IS200-like domain-containing protein n=1 Tax=Streptomyces tamarix TaxID=3078565 RepID=A0ABU3QQK2_9ACTN|nr:hypothetical protein [Streptomyces tamarix]MDT9685026.1 hypothetical protein [Streptomyces tamarix]